MKKRVTDHTNTTSAQGRTRQDPPDSQLKACLPGQTRRDWMKTMLLAGAGLAAAGCSREQFDAFRQRHLHELSPEEIREVIARLEGEYARKYGRQVTVATDPPLDGTLFGYALDLSRCVGCRRCVYACVEENNQSREPQVHWIRVLQMEKEEGVNVLHAEHYYDPDLVPALGHFYMPIQCHQCKNPPCVKACPVAATWQEPDGITVVDYNWCIGCRYCMAACPYGARHFNWGEPEVAAEDINPDTHYLGNRPRQKGVVEKCTFCLQRVRRGRYPACVEICPTGARKFGNLLDPDSDLRYILEEKRVYIFKEELNTQPKFYYFYGV